MAVLYDLHNQATHGGSLMAKHKKPIDQVLEESFGLPSLSLSKSIELEPSNG